MIARKPLITIQEGIILIQEYLFDRRAVRANVNLKFEADGQMLDKEKYEQAVTVASNYYAGYQQM